MIYVLNIALRQLSVIRLIMLNLCYDLIHFRCVINNEESLVLAPLAPVIYTLFLCSTTFISFLDNSRCSFMRRAKSYYPYHRHLIAIVNKSMKRMPLPDNQRKVQPAVYRSPRFIIRPTIYITIRVTIRLQYKFLINCFRTVMQEELAHVCLHISRGKPCYHTVYRLIVLAPLLYHELPLRPCCDRP